MKDKIKYIIIFAIACLSFMFIDDVLAVGNTGPFNGLNISQSGNFIRHNSNSNVSLGYNLNFSTSGSGQLDGTSYYYASPATDSSLVYTDKGISLLQCDMSFLKDNYYSVSYYFVSDSFAYYYHPAYTNLTNKVGISNNITMTAPTFAYDTVSHDIQYKLIEGIGFLQSYTIIFKASTTGTCLLSNFNSNPSGSALNINFVGYDYKHLGSSPLSASEITGALSSSFDSVSSKIDDYTRQTNERLDELNRRQQEQNETSKGIWQSLKDGIGSIGTWFADLLSGILGAFADLMEAFRNSCLDIIKSVGDGFIALRDAIGNFFISLAENIGGFFETLGDSIGDWFSSLWENLRNLLEGKEVCSLEEHEIEREVAPKPFYTYNSSDFTCGFYYDKGVKKNANHMCSTDYISFNDSNLKVLYFKSSSVSGGLTIQYYDKDKNYLTRSSVSSNDTYSNFSNEYGSFILYDRSSINQFLSNVSYITMEYNSYIGLFNFTEIYSSVDPVTETVIVEEQVCERKGGLFGILNDLTKSIGKWFQDLLKGILDGIKALFVPTDDQLYEIVNDSKDLTENFGFVGESINFILTIFTSLLGLVNANGCVELPEFSIGETSLFPAHKFWDSQNVCLGDNVILSRNITTIRTITSIVLVAMFVNFAASKFFDILSKNDSYQATIDSGDIRSGSK